MDPSLQGKDRAEQGFKMSDTVGDIQNYLADFNPKDPVISKAEPVLTGGEAGDDSELLSSAVGGT